MDLADLNRLSDEDAHRSLAACCASEAWVRGMLSRRPFTDLSSLLAAAEEVWWDLTPDDWLEAFAAHPRIGEAPSGDDTHSRWSRREQAAASSADGTTMERLAACNAAYEDRFGFTFIVFASDRTADEILEVCRSRLSNDEVREMTVAAGEQARITNLRLRVLLGATQR